MIRLSIILTSILLLGAGCSNRSGSSTTDASSGSGTAVFTNASHSADTTTVPVKITKAFFIDNIMDYENSEVWKYKGSIPAIVDFYADWCPPCKVSNPILEELAKEYSGSLRIYKVDVDAEQELAAIFGIQSIPSFLFIPMEGQPTMSAGIASSVEATKEMFVQQISDLLKVSAASL